MGTQNRRRWIYPSVATLLAAFSLFEAVKYGWIATTTIAIFFTVPGVVLLARSASARNVARSYWPPIALAALSLTGWPDLWLRPGLEVFLAGLAWATHVTVVRAVDVYRSEASHGRQRVGADSHQA